MERDELAAIIRRSASDSLKAAGNMPLGVLGVALGWTFEVDPQDEAGREGFRLNWWTYFDQEPGEVEAEFAATSSDDLVGELWRRLIWVDHQSIVTKSLPTDLPWSSGCWLYRRVIF
ncbi:hypothetical protein [Dyella acidiphila]|uniref:Uncharacterized protein n=1 Tax=Dyella acidiphila TaxID=2775866 RepID=A0ABR9GCK4_9GAMM|nr:hypothetical protein [Dyella acidiphila]MBE1161775.1 hypothetical protein [Dyella acidiphila]